MSAKKQPKRPSKVALEEAETLVELLRDTLGKDEFREFEERLTIPEKAAEFKRREEKIRSMEEFVNSLQEIPAGYMLPEGFDESWEQLIADYEHDTRKGFAAAGHKPEHVDAWVKRGWITADLKTRSLVSHTRRPSDDTYPIPAVLTNDNGHWNAPSPLNMVLRLHPFVRAVSSQLPDFSLKEEVLDVIRRSLGCAREGDYHGTMLSQAANILDLWLYDQDSEDADYGWLHVAKDSGQFWQILNAAIGFGRTLASHEIFGDGSVEESIRRALLMSAGKRATGWRQFIEDELGARYSATGKILTPAILRGELGAELPNPTDGFLTFTDPRAAALPPIKWKEFQNRAKKAAQKLDL